MNEAEQNYEEVRLRHLVVENSSRLARVEGSDDGSVTARGDRR